MPNFDLDLIIIRYLIILKIAFKLEPIHHYHTRQKPKKIFFSHFCSYRMERKMIQRKGLKIWKKIPLKLKSGSFQKFKQTYKKNVIQSYINTS